MKRLRIELRNAPQSSSTPSGNWISLPTSPHTICARASSTIDNLARWVIEDSDPLLSETSREHLDKLRQRVKRMETLIEDLLDYSRAGRHHYMPELVDTGALVRDIFDLLAPPPGFAIVIDPHMPIFVTERLPLETVLRNLISNALKHHDHPETGTVSVSAHVLDSFVEFTVADNGPGIAPEFSRAYLRYVSDVKAT